MTGSPTAAEALEMLERTAFPNSSAERQARSIVHLNITEDTRTLENHLVEAATSQFLKMEELSDRARATETRLRQLTARLNKDLVEDTADLLEEWAALDREAGTVTELAVSLPDRMSLHLQHLGDPLAMLSALQAKYPLPRPAYNVEP